MNIIKWLLEGDISIKYQVNRDLLDDDNKLLKDQISKEGFGKKFLECQNDFNHWGYSFYQPKWISTHYTLLDLLYLNINTTDEIKNAIDLILKEYVGLDGGIDPSKTSNRSDVCINGMALNYLSYFNADENKLKSIIDYIILQKVSDGGFNCNYNNDRFKVKHSSLHSTISVLEGIRSYSKNGYLYRLNELLLIENEGINFILNHKLFKSDHTGKIINKNFTMLSFPSRWKYDILRALVYFVDKKVPYNSNMEDALELLISKCRKNGTWPVQNKHPGKVHFDMEKTGSDSRFNTLRAIKVLKYYKREYLLNRVLLKISNSFNKNNIKYAVGGSMVLKSYELISDVNDIDICINLIDIKKVKKIMDELGIEKKYEKNKLYLTKEFMKYNLDGIDIDIMADFGIKTDEGLYVYLLKNDIIQYEDIYECKNIPFASLENWYGLYYLMGRLDKANIIKNYFSKNGYNKNMILSFLKKEINNNLRNELKIWRF